MNNSYITIIKEKRTDLSRKRIPLNQNKCTADFRMSVPFEQNLHFRENGISKLPSYKALQAEIESLIKEKNSGYNDYRAKREEYRRLQTVKGNIDQILRRERKPVKRQEQER